MNYKPERLWLYGFTPRPPEVKWQDLRQLIKASDFIVMDKSGMHRAVGLHFDKKTMQCPKIMFICLSNQMAFVRQVAFSLGKRIFYDSEVSAKLFKYTQNDFILPEDYKTCAILYRKVWIKNPARPSIEINGTIAIKGKTLPPFFTVRDLTAILGTPDISHLSEEFAHPKEYIRNDWGLRVLSYRKNRGLIHEMTINIKRKNFSIPKCRHGVHVSKQILKICNKFGWEYSQAYCAAIRLINGENEIVCKKKDVEWLAIYFEDALSPLEQAMCEHRTEDFYKFLTKHLINKRNRLDGTTALMRSITENHTDFIRPLLKHGADVNAKNVHGFTALHYAIERKNMDIAKLLIDNGTDINSTCENGFTELHYTIWHEMNDFAELLIRSGADLDIKDSDGITPFMHAVLSDETLPIARLLKDAGCDVHAKYKNGKTALDVLAERNIQL